MKLKLLGLCLWFIGKSFGQIPQIAGESENIVLPLNRIGIDESSRSSMSVVPLFKLTNNQIHEYLDLVGADLKVTPKFTVIVPPTEYQGTLSYGYFFQQHGNVLWEPNRMPFLIEGGMRWAQLPKTRIWLDRNHNLRFDDEIPDTLYFGKSNQMIPYVAGSLRTSGVGISPFPIKQFYRFSQMNDMSIREMAGDRIFLGTEFSLKAERYNIRYDQVLFRSDTLSIGIIDANANGIFGDLGIDRFVVSTYRDSVISSEQSILITDDLVFSWMGFAYNIRIADTANLSLVISLNKKASKTLRTLLIGAKMPKFKFCVAKKDTPRFKSRRLRKRPTVLVIWSAENKDFIRDSALLHHQIRTSQKNIDWVFLNFGGSGKYVGYYNRRFEIDAIQGFCNSTISDKLKLQQLPQYLYFEPKNGLKYNGSNLKDLTKALDATYIDKVR